jgi:hypothetical protein
MDPISMLRRALFVAFATMACAFADVDRVKAQDVALPSPAPEASPQPTSPPPGTTVTPAPNEAPPPLIPADILPMPDAPTTLATPAPPPLQQLDEELKPKPLSAAAEEFRLRLEWRKLRNQVQNDPEVRAARAASDRARTDLERRKLLAAYFNIFADRAIAMAPQMKNYVNDRRRESLGSLAQPRVRPTPTPPPGAKPKPSPTPAAAVSPPPPPPLPAASPTATKAP